MTEALTGLLAMMLIALLRITVGPFVYFMALMIALTGLVHVYKMFVPGDGSANQATT